VGYERRYLRAQVDAVDENINVQNLLEWSAFGGFVQIPLENVIPREFSDVETHTLRNSRVRLLFQADLSEQLNRASATPSQSPDNECPGLLDILS